jgi:sporulation protein YlmC with PRC-barrel domain
MASNVTKGDSAIFCIGQFTQLTRNSVMKRKILYSLGSATLALLMVSAQAVYADTAATRGEATPHQAGDEPMAIAPALEKQIVYTLEHEGIHFLRVSDMLGKPVKNSEGKTIGKISDVVIENYSPFFDTKPLATQKPTEYRAVISVGGFLGMGNKLIAVPFEDIKRDRFDGIDHLVYPAGKEQLKGLPEFKYPELQ